MKPHNPLFSPGLRPRLPVHAHHDQVSGNGIGASGQHFWRFPPRCAPQVLAVRLPPGTARGMRMVTLDEIDVGIIQYLHKDARAPAKSIAESLKVPESTIRNRLGRLIESKVVEFVALTNPLSLGHSTW